MPLSRDPVLAINRARLNDHADYNGHVGIRELCDICLAAQSRLIAEDIDSRRHRADYDAQLTWRLFNAALTFSDATWNNLVDVCPLPGPAVLEDGLW